MGTAGLLAGVSFPRDTCELSTKQDPLLGLESDENHVDDDVTSTMSESSSGIGGLDRLVPSKTTERQTSGRKALHGNESDVDSGIVSCQLMDNHTASISSSETDSSRGSTSNEQKPRSISDSTQCVRFDEDLHLSEENIRRSCRKLFATLYSHRFSYPCYNSSSGILTKACEVGSVSPAKENGKPSDYYFSGRPVPHSRSEMTKIAESIPEKELQAYRYLMGNDSVSKTFGTNPNQGRDFSSCKNVQKTTKPEYRRSVSNVVYSSSKLISNVRQWNSEKTEPILYSGSQMNGAESSDKNFCRTNNPIQYKEDPNRRNLSADQRLTNLLSNRFESQRRAFQPMHQQNGFANKNCQYSKPTIHKSLSCTVLSASENLYLTLAPHDSQGLTLPRRTSDPISVSSLNITDGYDNHGVDRTRHVIPHLKHRNSMIRAYARVVPIVSDDTNGCASSKLESRSSKDTLKKPNGVAPEKIHISTPVAPNSVPTHSIGGNATKCNSTEMGSLGNGVKPGAGIAPVHKSSSYRDLNYSKPSEEFKRSSKLQKGRLYVSGRNGSVTRSHPSFLEVRNRESARHRSPSNDAIPDSSRGNVSPYKSFTNLNHLRTNGNRKSRQADYEVLDQSQKGRFNSLPVLDNLASVDGALPENSKRGLHQSDFTLYRNRPPPSGKSFLDRIQGFTRFAKNAVQKAFSTERIYRPEREERYEAEGQKLKRSRSFIRGLKERMSKKKRRESKAKKKLKPPEAQVVAQQRLNTSWDEPRLGSGSVTHVEGQLLQLNPDGSQVIELTKPPSKPYGFFVARGRIRNSRGIFVSRMRDQETEEHLTGLLGIGDEILEIEGLNVKHADILEVNSLMSQRNSLILTVLPYVCRKD